MNQSAHGAASLNEQPPATWYVEVNGERKGPLAASQVAQMIATKQLRRDSLVWRSGAADWEPLGSTAFAERFAHEPPPLAAKAIPSGLVWALAFAPLIGQFLAGFAAGVAHGDISNYWWVTLALNFALSLMDEAKLKKGGYDTKKMGSAWLIPVYLWRRAKVLSQRPVHFFVWTALFVLVLISGV